MGELWHDLVEMLRRRPILWLPVLLADLLGYGLNLLRNAFLRAMVAHQTAQHSVLGGAVVRTPLSPSAMQHAAVVALLLSWLTYFLRMLLYSAAFFTTVALVRTFLQRADPSQDPGSDAVPQPWGDAVDLALRALSVYALAALLFSWMSASLAKHGQTALLANPWLGYGLTLVVLLTLAFLLPPTALRMTSGRTPSDSQKKVSRQFASTLVFVASLLALFVSANSRSLALSPPSARYPLEITGSLVVALPYVLLFVGLAILGRRVFLAPTVS